MYSDKYLLPVVFVTYCSNFINVLPLYLILLHTFNGSPFSRIFTRVSVLPALLFLSLSSKQIFEYLYLKLPIYLWLTCFENIGSYNLVPLSIHLSIAHWESNIIFYREFTWAKDKSFYYSPSL